ncbi:MULTISPECIES: hypothetical protein [Pseudoalteromonas]|uniref:hypothetical protein n=1 Tax=Pseudoalteromonas TaxID=53246 RepID=UPI00051A8BA2|nr:hypothetical protein [Pseudoalteromonas sp. ND6B]KGK02035.1 hypothetical protein ND6B_1258 [Pseudoalteromonas sp. ND6B]
MNNKIQPHLGLVDHNNLKTGEEILSTINYEMFPDEKNFLIKKENYLVISTEFYSKMKKKKRLTQSEYPLTALPWIINQIENGFFKKKDEGGFSAFERSTTAEFDGETIGINAMVHCCAENLPGLNIWNGNRKSYVSDKTPQRWDIPNYMLKDGLLEELKKIADKYS